MNRQTQLIHNSRAVDPTRAVSGFCAGTGASPLVTEEKFAIRRAAPGDAAVIARHRARMFQDMGEVPSEMFEPLRAGAEVWIKQALESGEYCGWLAAIESSSEIVAGAGVQLRQSAPHPRAAADGDFVLAQGRQAVVINVFTEPAWRKRGLATRLMSEILNWARMERLDRLVLHASADGRGLYQRLGFAPTNEMRYTGDFS